MMKSNVFGTRCSLTHIVSINDEFDHVAGVGGQRANS